jgi:prepilin-type N-terminal cleavage/methylation domain-containing protein
MQKHDEAGGAMKRKSTGGFTLIEILIVIAIVAVLASIVMAGFAAVREKGRQTTCISQLHQIGLAYMMYSEDAGQRPRRMESLISEGYLKTPSLLVCPSDPWGNLMGLYGKKNGFSSEYANSYLYFSGFATPPARNYWWNRMTAQMGPAAGIVACKTHGSLTEHSSEPGPNAFQGKILRLQRDGAVVVRNAYPKIEYVPGTDQKSGESWDTWNLFSDKPRPN